MFTMFGEHALIRSTHWIFSCRYWQSYGGNVDCLKRPVRWGIVLLKDEELA